MTKPPIGLGRDRPIVCGRAALLIIDAQNATCGPKDKVERPEFHAAATERVIPNIRRLLAAFRDARLEVIYTVMENLTEDGRDRSLDYKLSNMSVAKGSWDAQVIAEIAPARDEIVLPKTSSSVFNSTTSTTSCAISASRTCSWPASSLTNASTMRSRTGRIAVTT
jgi:nicotinamidase-related amidase